MDLTLSRIPARLAGGVQGAGSIQRHLHLDERIVQSLDAELHQWQVASVRQLEWFDSVVSTNVASMGLGHSMEYCTPQMGCRFPTLCPNVLTHSCTAIHFVHFHSRWADSLMIAVNRLYCFAVQLPKMSFHS